MIWHLRTVQKASAQSYREGLRAQRLHCNRGYCILLNFVVFILSDTSGNSMKDLLICTEISRKQKHYWWLMTINWVMSSREKHDFVLWRTYSGDQVRIRVCLQDLWKPHQKESISVIPAVVFLQVPFRQPGARDSAACWSCWSSAVRMLHLML